jgi:hypothetical protein
MGVTKQMVGIAGTNIVHLICFAYKDHILGPKFGPNMLAYKGFILGPKFSSTTYIEMR